MGLVLGLLSYTHMCIEMFAGIMFPKKSKKLATQFCSCNFWDFLHVLMCIFLIHECRPTYHVRKTLTTGYNATVLYVKLLVPFLRISSHVERPTAFVVCIRSFILLTDTQNLPCPTQQMMIMIHLSAGFATPSGMLQPGGYQIPPLQHLYSGGGRYQPTFTPPQLPQQCIILLCC